MTAWLIPALVLVAAVVLAVTLWRSRHPADPNGGRAALERAEAQREQVQPLIRDLRARRAENNFAPLIERALRPGGH